MALTAIAGAELLYQGYSAIEGNQEKQKAKGQASTLIDQQAAQPANDAAAASVAAKTAAVRAGGAAKSPTGQASTILTSPLGAGTAPTARKTLLGL